MNIHFPTWFPIAPKAQAGASGAQDAPEAPRHPVGQGPITGCDLSELTSLSGPFVRDPFDRLRPPFSREAAELSLELASMAYTLDLDPWAEAGWNDFSIQIDDTKVINYIWLVFGITGFLISMLAMFFWQLPILFMVLLA